MTYTLNKNYDEIKNLIQNETLRDLVDDTITKTGMDEEKVNYATEVAHWCYKLLEDRGVVTDNVHQGFVDVILFGALIHNAYTTLNKDDPDSHIYDVFKARENLDDFFANKGVPSDYRNSIFQLIESQYGATFEIPYVRPQADSPQSTLATAKFIVDTIENNLVNCHDDSDH